MYIYSFISQNYHKKDESQRLIKDYCNIQGGALCNNSLGCCSSPRSPSKSQTKIKVVFALLKKLCPE